MIVNENSSAFMPALDVPRDISLIADAAGMVRFVSPDAALFYAGEASNGINGRSMFDLIVPDDQSEAREWWAALVDSAAPSGEIRLGALGAGSQPEPVQIVAWRLPDEQGYLLKHHLDDFTRERLATLYTILLATSVTLELDELLDIVLQRSLHLIPADSVTAFLVDRDGRLDLMRISGPEPEQLSPEEVEAVAGFATTRTVRETGRALLITDCETNPIWVKREGSKHIRSWLGAPLIYRGNYLGMLALNSTRPNNFSGRCRPASGACEPGCRRVL